jgi:hypothetical protein
MILLTEVFSVQEPNIERQPSYESRKKINCDASDPNGSREKAALLNTER